MAMRQAASYLVGMHDFKSFATAKPEVTDTVRTIYETSLEKEDDLIRFRITRKRFSLQYGADYHRNTA